MLWEINIRKFTYSFCAEEFQEEITFLGQRGMKLPTFRDINSFANVEELISKKVGISKHFKHYAVHISKHLNIPFLSVWCVCVCVCVQQ